MTSKRNIAPIKNTKQKYSVVILASGIGSRTKSWGSKSLLYINNTTTLIQHQLNIISKAFHSPEIVLVTGFEADRLMNQTPYGIIKIENEKYEDNNNLRTLGIGLRACTTGRVVVINGDMLFNESTLLNCKFNSRSVMVVDMKSTNSDDNVGCTVDNNKVEYMLWGLAHPWQHIMYLTGRELIEFQHIAWNRNKSNLLIFEAANAIIEGGGQFTVQSPDNMHVLNIKSSTEIQQLKDENRFHAYKF